MTNFLNLFCLKMSLFLLLLKDNFSGYKIWCVTFFSPKALSSSAFMFVQFQKSCPMSFVSLFLMRRDFPFSLPLQLLSAFSLCLGFFAAWGQYSSRFSFYHLFSLYSWSFLDLWFCFCHQFKKILTITTNISSVSLFFSIFSLPLLHLFVYLNKLIILS